MLYVYIQSYPYIATHNRVLWALCVYTLYTIIWRYVPHMEIWCITWGFGAPYILHAYILHFLSLSLPEWRQFVYMGYEVILTSQKMQPSNDRTCVQCNIIAGVDMYIDWRQCIFNSATLSSRVADGSGLLLCSFYICVWQFVSVSLSLSLVRHPNQVFFLNYYE